MLLHCHKKATERNSDMFLQKPADLQTLIRPFWQGDIVYEESFFPLMQEDEDEQTPLSIPLLCQPAEILSVTRADRSETLTEGRDYVMCDGGLIIPASSAIRRFAWNDYRVTGEGSEKYPFACAGGGTIFFGEGTTMHEREYLVTYRRRSAWDGFIPTPDSHKLPRTKKLLAAGDRLCFCFFGDSITTGANSSEAIGAAPFIPMFPRLVCMALEERFGVDIRYVNHAVGGTVSEWGAQRLAADFADEKPDIMFIGFGMNDASGHVEKEKFIANIRKMVDDTRACSPDCEFLLCSTTLPNPMAPTFCWNHEEHEPLLAALCDELGSSAALVPMTSVHKALLKKKRFYDMTGNNINHPCDFLARVYAQTILAQLL